MENSSHDKRVATVERNHAIDVLGNAFADGYLTLEEFEERTERAVQAVHRSDIERLLTDLPSDPTEMVIRGLPDHRAETELAELRNKGKKLKIADGFTIAFMVFCFTVSVLTSTQWLLFVGMFGVAAGLIGSRLILDVSDAEEDFLEEIEAEEHASREERLRIALQRRKELGG